MGKFYLPSLAAVTVAVAACGGGGGGGASTAAKRPGGGSRPTRLYTIALSGRAEVPKGAPAGRGFAIIAFHGSATVCWRFAHLHGFTNATIAHINTGLAGRTGPAVLSISHGSRLHHQGCVAVSPTLTHSIWSNPTGYYVSIQSAGYPAGAVRGQL